jgi:hypothetical protein
MNKIIIEPKNEEELLSLEKYLKQHGIGFKTEDEYFLENQKQKMNLFAEMVSSAPKTDISNIEIDTIVDEIRAKRYEENHS